MSRPSYIYITVESYYREGDNILGVFDTLPKAKAQFPVSPRDKWDRTANMWRQKLEEYKWATIYKMKIQ